MLFFILYFEPHIKTCDQSHDHSLVMNQFMSPPVFDHLEAFVTVLTEIFLSCMACHMSNPFSAMLVLSPTLRATKGLINVAGMGEVV